MNSNEVYLIAKGCPKKAVSARAKEMTDKGQNVSKSDAELALKRAMMGNDRKDKW